ncbi:ATP-grasp domain-containing protein [Nocardiopsis sp. NPDC055879]
MPSDRASILVTAAGAEGTAGKILGLRDAGYRVVAVDTDPEATGLYLADQAYVVPPGQSPEYVPEITRICAAERIRAIVPLVDEELVAVWALAKLGIQILLPHADLVTRCLDKLTLMEFLDETGVSVPRTRLATRGTEDLAFPVIGKPRRGRGSRGVFLARHPSELKEAMGRSAADPDQIIVQEYVTGPEFSVSVVAWRDRRIQAVVPKEVVFKNGSSRYAISRHDSVVTEECVKAAHALDADGPLNVQLRVDASGTPYVFEINPRFSGSAILTAAAGVDEIGGLLAQALDDHRSVVRDSWHEGVAMIRHSTETFVAEPTFTDRHRSLERNS